MLKISRESEINLVNVLIDNDIISGKDLINIKKVSTESNKSQIDAIFELKLTDEQKIIDLLIKEQNLETVDLKKVEITEEIKSVLPSNYIKMNFVAPFSIASISSSGAFSRTSPASPKSESKVFVFCLSSRIDAIVTSSASLDSLSINSEMSLTFAACNSIFFFVIAFRFLISPSFGKGS